ncbi:MAG: class I adenylate-forming enzyme family protein [Chromatiales bacterium]
MIDSDDRQFSYAEFWANAQLLAEQWGERGIKPGQVIAFVLPNSAALPCCYLACAIGGFVACPIIASYTDDMTDALIALAGADLVVTEIGPLSLSASKQLEPSYELQGDVDSPFLILFTSGSTGLPKAMLHSLRNIIGSAQSFARLTGMSSRTRLYHVLPMAYMAGILNAFFAPLVAAGCIVEGPMFSPLSAVDFWERPLQHGVNVLSLTPTIAKALLRFTRDSQTLAQIAGSITQVQCTSAPIRHDLARAFLQHFQKPLQNCYGMTEICGPLSFQSEHDARQLRDWSRLADELEVEIRHQPDARSPGELWLKSPFMMLGYLDRGSLNRPFDAAGFMDTGDLADLAGRDIHIAGRKKDIIIRGGINISPQRIEIVLSGFPAILDCAVLGQPHDFWGEQIVACIVTDTEQSFELEQLMRYLRDQLAEHERPDRVITLVELPRTPIGKLQKAELVRQLEMVLEIT